MKPLWKLLELLEHIKKKILENYMTCCEKCWEKAYTRSRITGKSQAECYQEILKEVEETGIFCTPEEQAGQYWDDIKKKDKRNDLER